MAVEPSRYHFTVEEYERVAQTGIFDDRRVELIEGEIVEMAPIGPGHMAEVNGLNEIFVIRFRDAAIVSPQNAIRILPRNVPQPDIALLRRREDRYRASLPEPRDVLLVVEVADSSLSYDRNVKAPLYARAGIAEFWLVDVAHHLLYVYRDPTDGGYLVVQTYRSGDRITPLAFPDRELEVRDLLV